MAVFSTERLWVRKLEESDFDAFHEMQSDDDVMRYVDGHGKDNTKAVNREQLAECITAYDLPDNEFWIWAVINPDNNFVGTCAIVKNEKDECEIGYRFLQKYWGQGYGTEIVNPLIDYASQKLQKPTIIAYVDVRNSASVKILDGSKMEFVGEIQSGDITDRKYIFQSTT